MSMYYVLGAKGMLMHIIILAKTYKVPTMYQILFSIFYALTNLVISISLLYQVLLLLFYR